MASQRLEKLQVDIVYLLSHQLLLDAAGAVHTAKGTATPRPAGFYLALRPTAAKRGDYAHCRYVGPLGSASIAEKLRVSALALGAWAPAPGPRPLVACLLEASKPSLGSILGEREALLPSPESQLHGDRDLARKANVNRIPAPAASGRRSPPVALVEDGRWQ